MINLMDPADLPKSFSNGPETWGEAWSKAAETTDETMRLVENTTADIASIEKAYDDRIAAIREITGQEMPNPIRDASGVGRDYADILASQAGGAGFMPAIGDLDPDYRRREEEEFNERVRGLAGPHRAAIDELLSTPINQVRNRVMQETQRDAGLAAQSPELGFIGRFSAQIVGGLIGAARDPVQWGMSFLGAGGSAAKTVAGRIGQTMATEALINGGSELLLQGMSQERKREAGLEHGMKDMLTNAGIAATFGAVFGSAIQGGMELAKVFKLGEGGAERAARVLEGQPEPGDVEALAKAMNVELGPEKLDMISRSFEERALDEVSVPADATPAQLRVLEAAQHYAEDPERFPPPEIVERVLEAQDGGRALDAAPEQIGRAMAGDRQAIEEISDVVAAERQADGEARIDAQATRIDDVASRVDQLEAIADAGRLDELARQKVPVGAKPRSPQSLMDFIASEGGIREDGGELRALGLSRKFVPGRGALVRQTGQSLDYAREAAAQAGYFNHLYGTSEEAAAKSTVADLLDLLDQESRGNAAFTPDDAGRVAAMDAYRQQLDARAEYRDFLGKLEAALREVAPEGGIDDAILVRATDLMIEEDLTPLAAFDRAALEEEARVAEFAEEIGEGYRDEPDFEDIPFFDEPEAGVAEPGGAARAQEPDRVAGAGRADEEIRDQSQGPGEAARDGLDPLDGQSIAPARAIEPLEEAAMRVAEEQAGEIVDPAIDVNGNPESLLDFIPIEDGDGNVRLVSTREALEAADEGNFLADLLESCKL